MLKRAAALLVLCAGIASLVSCGKTTSNYLYAALPAASEIAVYREDPNSGILTVLSFSPVTAGPGVQALAVHPSGKFLYAANNGANNVSLFTIGVDGGLTEVTPRTDTDTGPNLLAMDPGGAFLYVGNSGSNDISVFSIDSGSGALSPVAGSPFAIGISPLNMKLSKSGSFLYVTGSEVPGVLETLGVNAGVPTLIQVSQTERNPYGLAITPDGAHLYVANDAPDNSISEFAINSDGTLTPLAGSPIGESYTAPVAALVDNSGKYLYVANEGSNNLAGYSIDPTGGGISLLTNSPFVTNAQPVSIASDTAGKYLYVGNSSTAAIESFLLDGGTGTLTKVDSKAVGNTATSIVITP